MASQRIAFIGIGIMGGPMAGHLLAAGHSLTVHTRTKSKAEPLLSRGAMWADSPADAAQQADFVFICVSDTPDVQAVIEGKNGVLSAARAGMIVVDHSTISPKATREMSKALSVKGTAMLDAPVSGGDTGAKNATLSIMVGGDQVAFERTQPLFAHMGKTITWCGPSGAGQLTKLVNQILVSVTNLAVCEALTWQLSDLGPKMIAEDFRPGFMIKLQAKDLRLADEAAREAGIDLSALRLVHSLFNQSIAEGRGDEGTQALFAVVRESSKK
jgi:3-hydroxyisobutyrate dehydrogenase